MILLSTVCSELIDSASGELRLVVGQRERERMLIDNEGFYSHSKAHLHLFPNESLLI